MFLKKIFIFLTISLGVVAIFSTLGIVIFFNQKNDYKSNFIKYDYKKNGDAKIQINNYALQVNPYLTKEITKNINDMAIDKLAYGPELNLLKEVKLLWNVKDTNTAFFNQDQNFIGINLNNIAKIYNLNLNKEKYSKYEINNIAEIIFQYFFHEYLHFISKIYIRKQNENIYLGKGAQRHKQRWHQIFLDSFKNILKYDIKTALIKQEKPKNVKLIKNSYKIWSLASIYNVKDLFDISNSKKDPKFDFQNKKFGFFHPQTKRNILNSIDKNYLDYLYSIDELFSRKYQQLFYPFRPTIKNIYKNINGINEKGYFYNKGFLIETPFLEDVHYYQDSLQNDNSLFFQDYVFSKDKKNQNNLFNLFNKFTGVKSLKPISVIQKTFNKVSFGGFLKNFQFNYVGFQDKANKFKTIPIFKYKYNVKQKKSLIDSFPKDTFNQFVYYLKNKIDINEIKNNALYFSVDKAGLFKQKMSFAQYDIEVNSYEWNSLDKNIVTIKGDNKQLYLSLN